MGSYAFNSTGSFPDPTEVRWMDRSSKGISGDGHTIYPSARKFEMSWDLLSSDEVGVIVGFYNLVQSTGTFVATLPQYGRTWNFFAYTGCTMQEPSVGKFFETYAQNVTLLIMDIIT